MDFYNIRAGLSGELDSVQETAIKNSYDLAAKYGLELTGHAADGTTEVAGPGFTGGLAVLAAGGCAAFLAWKRRDRTGKDPEYNQTETETEDYLE